MNNTEKCELGYYNSYRENDGGHVSWVTDRERLEDIEVQTEKGKLIPFSNANLSSPIEWRETRYGWDGYDMRGVKTYYLRFK